MQIASVSISQYGNHTAPLPVRDAGVQTASSGPGATEAPKAPQGPDSSMPSAELPSRPALSALASDGATETAALGSGAGSGGVPAKMAAALYTLELSFEIQAQALDLLA